MTAKHESPLDFRRWNELAFDWRRRVQLVTRMTGSSKGELV